jgi:hypothetical protein
LALNGEFYRLEKFIGFFFGECSITGILSLALVNPTLVFYGLSLEAAFDGEAVSTLALAVSTLAFDGL